MKNANTYLPKETAKGFKVVNWHGGHRQIFGHFGEVDLKTLTPERADILVKSGFHKLEKKKHTKSSPDNNSEE